MTRSEIEELNDIRPYCFETDGEEKWYEIGCIDGLDAADAEPDTTELWHEGIEEPQEEMDILCIIKNGNVHKVSKIDHQLYDWLKENDNIQKWAYIEDLLPKKK